MSGMQYGTGLVNELTGLEEWDPKQFTKLWQRFAERWVSRDRRMALIERVVRGEWSVVDEDDSRLQSKSPNIIQVGLEDTAAAVAMVPTVRVSASRHDREKEKKQAAVMEQLGASYFDQAGGKLFFQASSINTGAYGFCAWNVVADDDGTRIEWREAATCYPEPDIGTFGVARRMFFAREVYASQLPDRYREALRAYCAHYGYDHGVFDGVEANKAVVLLEYSDVERVTVGLAFDASTLPYIEQSQPQYGKAHWVSVLVDDFPNSAGMCRGVYGQMPSLDGQPRGQYDQVIPVLHAHIRLVAAALEHANQAVYNELVVVDPLQQDIPQGPDAVIELGAQGKAFRLPPATVGFSFFEQATNLLEAVHVGSRWPKNRPGDISQSQASSKFVESTLGVQNAVIATHHSLFERMAAQAARVAFALDKREGRRRTIAGTLRNQQFQLEFDRDDIDLSAHTRVEYGLGFGRDVSQSAVLTMQLLGGEIISLEDAQENYPGITNVDLTRSRLLAEQFEKGIMAKIMMGVQGGMIDDEALVKMVRKARKGDDLAKVFEECVVKPAKAALEQQMMSPLTGDPLMPGAPPGAEGPVPPAAPPPQDVLAGLLGGEAGMGAPSPTNRLSVPLGDGSFVGSQQL